MKIKIAVVAIVLLVRVLGWAITRSGHNTAQPTPSNSQSGAVTAPALIVGNPAAKATITEYGDFKCPVCNRFFHITEPELKQTYFDTGKAKLVFKNLAHIAPDSKTAAAGAFCAADQSMFPAYHDKLYNYIWDNYFAKGLDGESTEVFTSDRVISLAAETGLDQLKFKDCLVSGKYNAAVDQDNADSQNHGFYGTPTFVVGNQTIQGAQAPAVFKPLIEAQL